MAVPFEALLPYGIMLAMFGATGAGLAAIKTYRNDGKNPRWNNDQWDIVLMQRDQRLTGKKTGQIANATAPPGFEVNNPWKLEKRFS